MEAFSPPPNNPELARSKLVWDGSSVSWVLEHERIKRNCFSPLDSHQKLTRYRDELTPESAQLANAAYMALLAPFPMASLMDADDAKTCLTLVSEKVVTRAEVKRMKADAAEALKEEKKRVRGEARAAHRCNVAQRPVKTQRTVDNCMRVHLS